MYKRYRDFTEPYSGSRVHVGGARVSKILLNDGLSATSDTISHFSYTESFETDSSSGVLTDYFPNHHYYYRHDTDDSTTMYFVRYVRLPGLLIDRGYHLGYETYQVQQGSDGGKTEVTVVSPATASNVSNEEFPYAYPTPGGWKRGQVSHSKACDMDGDPRQQSWQTYATYDNDGDINRNVIYGLKASLFSTADSVKTDSIKYVSSWSHPVYSRNASYTVDGLDSLINESWSYYDNTDHMNLTRSKRETSAGETIYTKSSYPMDYGSGTNNSKSAAITRMGDSLNMQRIPIETITYKGSDLIAASLRTFKVSNGSIIQDTSFTYDLDEPLALGSFDTAYIDGSGNFTMDSDYRGLNSTDSVDVYNRVLQAHGIHGSPSVTLYGYNGLYSIASFSNATLDEIAYSSFECDQKGNFSYTDSYIAEDTCAITGSSLLTGGNIIRSGLPVGSYYLTFWSSTTLSPSVGGGSAMQIDNGSVNRQGMRFFKYLITANSTTTVTLSSVSKLDEVRIFPVGASVQSRTYIPLLGVDSKAGINSIPSYTSFDVFGRLKLVKDQDKYIIR